MADLISAIAALLWPLLVIAVLLIFGRQLLKLNNSDDVTLEIGGQKLSIKQAADQQTDMISDLQHEVAALKAHVEQASGSQPWGSADEVDKELPADKDVDTGFGGDFDGDQAPSWTSPEKGWPVPGGWQPSDLPSPATGEAPSQLKPPPVGPRARSVLWIDDHPENNAMLAESWRRDGAQVEIARSTSEALDRLLNHEYGMIISDMGRRESDVDVPDAGLRFLSYIRSTDPHTPFVLYGNVEPFADAARAAGASLVTGSTFELVEFATELGMFGTT